MRVNAKLAFGLISVLFHGLALADISLPFAPPPTPLARTVEVPEGGRIDIPLTIVGAPTGRALEFVIRQPPAKGRLDPVRNSVRGDSAIVTYTHNPSAGGGRDQFSFAVQSVGGGISGSATIDVRIAENPPRLMVLPAWLDFGPAPLEGPPVRAQFTLVNQGGGVATGRILLQAPWRLEGEDSYRLTRGQRKTFAVLFQPPRPSAFEGEVRFGASFDQVLRLTGSGLPGETPEPAPPAAAAAVTPTPTTLPGRLPTPQPTPLAGASPIPTPTPQAAAKDPEPPEAPLSPGGDPAFPNEPGGAIPLAGFRLDLDPSRAGVLASWELPQPAPPATMRYRLERRELYFDDAKHLQTRWVPVETVGAVQVREDRMILRPVRLPGGLISHLRVVALEGDGTLRGHSAMAWIELPAAPASRWWIWLLPALLAGGGWLAWRAAVRR
ncbi:MAG: hypothetical protein JSR82_18680 [Verrucomicrobia bacterium]|nr:hypothetical protein [Verrucomicrobiota bacterium]